MLCFICSWHAKDTDKSKLTCVLTAFHNDTFRWTNEHGLQEQFSTDVLNVLWIIVNCKTKWYMYVFCVCNTWNYNTLNSLRQVFRVTLVVNCDISFGFSSNDGINILCVHLYVTYFSFEILKMVIRLDFMRGPGVL